MKTDYDFSKALPKLASAMEGASEQERHANAAQQGFTYYLNYVYAGPGEKKTSQKGGYYCVDMTEAIYWQKVLRNLKLTSEIVALGVSTQPVSAPITPEFIYNLTKDLDPEESGLVKTGDGLVHCGDIAPGTSWPSVQELREHQEVVLNIEEVGPGVRTVSHEYKQPVPFETLPESHNGTLISPKVSKKEMRRQAFLKIKGNV